MRVALAYLNSCPAPAANAGVNRQRFLHLQLLLHRRESWRALPVLYLLVIKALVDRRMRRYSRRLHLGIRVFVVTVRSKKRLRRDTVLADCLLDILHTTCAPGPLTIISRRTLVTSSLLLRCPGPPSAAFCSPLRLKKLNIAAIRGTDGAREPTGRGEEGGRASLASQMTYTTT